jgi:hypothetical protein
MVLSGPSTLRIETHLPPESVRAITDRLSPDGLVVVNRGSNVRLRMAAHHARGDGESGNFVVDLSHGALACHVALARETRARQVWGGCGEEQQGGSIGPFKPPESERELLT